MPSSFTMLNEGVFQLGVRTEFGSFRSVIVRAAVLVMVAVTMRSSTEDTAAGPETLTARSPARTLPARARAERRREEESIVGMRGNCELECCLEAG